MNKKISIVGVGTDGEKTLTKEAFETIKNAEILIGAKRLIGCFEHLEKPAFSAYKCADILRYIGDCGYSKIVILMSGDCGFYSGAEKILPLISEYETEIICGISSPIYFCSRLKIPWQDLKFVSLHGRENNIVRNVCANEFTFFLLGGEIAANDVCKRLCDYGLSNVTVHIGENLGYKNERILSGFARDLTEIKADNLCVIIVQNSGFEKCLRSGIPDSEFIRGGVPMTKAEVRCICVSRLGIAPKSVCWDIGCGTGSMSVEMAFRCFDGRVFSVDKNSEAANLTNLNRKKFGCDNIEIIQGNAENAVENLPAPDCVFIGGAGEFAGKIISAAYEKNLSAQIVATAVSLEALENFRKVFELCSVETEITQIAVTRTKKVGTHTMLSAENPIFLIRGAKNEANNDCRN